MLEQVRQARAQLRGLRVGEGWAWDGEVRWRVDGGVGWIDLDRPLRQNAMSLHLMDQLAEAIEQVWAWEGAVVVLRSAVPGVFCAGGDLGEVRRGLASPEAGAAAGDVMTTLLDALWLAPAVTIAVVEGAAVGGGAELVTAADLRVWSAEGWVEFRQAALGVATGWGGARRLATQVGRSRAVRLLATGDRVDAAQAQAIGLADEVVEAGAVEGALQALLGSIASADPAAVRACKAQVLLGTTWDSGVHAAQVALFGSTWGSEAHRQRLAAAGRGSS